MSQLPAPPEGPRSIAYLGSPDAAVAPLRVLVSAGYSVDMVVSAPDRRRGRGGRLMPTPVKTAALDLGLSVSDDITVLLDSGIDLGVVVAYGRLIRLPLLESIPFVNLHYSLLPRWRGAAPVERAILAGDEQTGVCVMAVAEALDEGGIYRQAHVDIGHKSADELRSELSDLGASLLLDALANGFGPPVEQSGDATYAEKVGVGEREVDWSSPAVQVDRVIRIGGAWTTFRGKRLKIAAAAPADPGGLGSGAVGTVEHGAVVCGDRRLLRLDVVQPEGKAPMAAAAWLNGAQPTDADVLGRS